MELLKKLPHPEETMSREELLALLLREEYGKVPPLPTTVTATVERENPYLFANKSVKRVLTLHCEAEFGSFSFPVSYVCPKGKIAPLPSFVHINFSTANPDIYQPTEELVDGGFATLTFACSDITSDAGDFESGLAGVVYPDGKRGPGDCGKIGLWAWAACAVLRYAMTLPELDPTRISVVGHSRLGKTALLAGALEERFFCAFSNDSGCSGAALSRENTGETVAAIVESFPYWFAENYQKYANNEDALPFDQHVLLAANASHRVYVASAKTDAWACPKNEYLSCVAASDYFEKVQGTGFIRPDRMPKAGDCFHEGHIGYHLRAGSHFLGREDWNNYMRYVLRHSKP